MLGWKKCYGSSLKVDVGKAWVTLSGVAGWNLKQWNENMHVGIFGELSSARSTALHFAWNNRYVLANL